MKQKAKLIMLSLIIIPCMLVLVACQGPQGPQGEKGICGCAATTVPGAVTNLQLTKYDAWNSWLTWEAPKNNGGMPILFYEVWMINERGIGDVVLVSVNNNPKNDSPTISYLITLGTGEATIFIRAANANGFGETVQIVHTP